MEWDFEGWATVNDLKCSDGKVIRNGAFKVQDGTTVPLIYNHQHGDPNAVLGHCLLKNKDRGVYAYGKFNNTRSGQMGKEWLKNGDIDSLSILAHKLDLVGQNVMHGSIVEVSLVLAGANPGARIESVMCHGAAMDDDEDQGILYTGEPIVVSHAAETDEPKKGESENKDGLKLDSGKTVGDVYKTMNEDQKLVCAIIGTQMAAAAKETENEEEEEDDEKMKHNAFEGKSAEGEEKKVRVLTNEDAREIIAHAKDFGGSLKAAFKDYIGDDEVLIHAAPSTGMIKGTGTNTYGIRDASMLFPDYKTVNGEAPTWISRDMEWVTKVLDGAKRVPFSRIKSLFADITEDTARAKGYLKGSQKKTEFFTTLKRTTDPQTVYKFQKMDRDDILDITGFDVIAWLEGEMRMMLKEEIARAILIGDGRLADAEDKIQENHIRPIMTDVPLFNTQVNIGTTYTGETLVEAAIRNRKSYKGSGTPTLFTTETVLADMLLTKDTTGRRIYSNVQELTTAMRVSSIVTVEPMENVSLNSGKLVAIMVNMNDYVIGSDKGGQTSFFTNFDLNYNKMEYLIEAKLSGALVRPYAAITFYSASTTPPSSGGQGGSGDTTGS